MLGRQMKLLIAILHQHFGQPFDIITRHVIRIVYKNNKLT